MRKLLFTTLIYLFYFLPTMAEVVNKINITGNSRVSNETIKIYGGIKINENYTEQDLNRILNNLFSTSFPKSPITNAISSTSLPQTFTISSTSLCTIGFPETGISGLGIVNVWGLKREPLPAIGTIIFIINIRITSKIPFWS